MKASHIAKSIAFTTALGVFLTGCGGGPESTNGTSSSNSRTTTPTTALPTAAPVVTSNGSGTIGYTSNETIDAVKRGQDEANAKLDKALKGIEETKKSSKSNSSVLTAVLGISAALGAAMLLKNINIGAKVGKAKGSFWAGAKAGLFGDDSEINKANINKAATDIRNNDNVNTDSLSGQITQGDAALAEGVRNTNNTASIAAASAGAAAKFSAESIVLGRQTNAQLVTVSGAVSQGNEAAMRGRIAQQRRDEAVAANVVAIGDKITNLSDQLSSAEASIRKAQTDSSAITASQISQLKSDLATKFSETLSSVQKSVGDLKLAAVDVATFESAIQALSQRIGQLNAAVTSLTSSLPTRSALPLGNLQPLETPNNPGTGVPVSSDTQGTNKSNNVPKVLVPDPSRIATY